MYNPMAGTQGIPGLQAGYLAPMWGMQQRMMPQRAEMIKVTGMEGAKAYMMEPNSAVALFDAEKPLFYLKSTDGAGFPTIKAYDYSPHEEQMTESPEYITRKEFDAWKEAFINEQQQRVSAAGKRNGKQSDE